MATIDRRIGLLFLIFVGLLGTALLRATYLGSVRSGKLKEVAATQQVTKVTLPAQRGSITDRNGVELAISQTAYDIAADPYLIKDPETIAAKLAPLLHRSQTKLLTLLSKPHTGFVYIAHLVPGDRTTAVKKLGIDGLSIHPADQAGVPALVGGLAGARQRRLGRPRAERDRVPL